MDKPTCRLCGAKHYSHEPHEIKTSVDAAIDVGCRRGVDIPKQKFDRNAYQREYMKKWRALKKAKSKYTLIK